MWRRSENVFDGDRVSASSLVNTLTRDFNRTRENAEELVRNTTGWRIVWLRNDRDQVSEWIAFRRD